MGPWWDSHCHLADLRLDLRRENWLETANSKGIRFFLQGGVGPEDWQKQIALAQRHPGHIGLCFGLHPYWIAAHDEELCEEALDQLARKLPLALAAGETGLDFRPHIMKDSRERQISFFEMQLELAQTAKKPLVLHLVQAHEEGLRILDLWAWSERRGFVHSFNGSAFKMKELTERGLLISVGGPLLKPDNSKLKQAVKECPLEFLLVETDAPDQPEPQWKDQLNPLESLVAVAEEVAKIKEMTYIDVLEISKENLKRVLDVKENPDGTVNQSHS